MARKISLVLLVIIILIGFALRLYQLDAVAFRGDEAFSVQYWAGQPLATTFTEIATIEPHPPLTYVLFRLWGLLVGTEHEFALRLLGVLPNTIGIAAMYALGLRLSGDRRVALVAAALWAIHPFQIWHAQDFRNYALWAGLSVITLWSALRVIDTRDMKDWLLYISIATIASYIFYMELVTIGVLSLYVLLLYWRELRFVVRWSLINGSIIGLTFAAYFIAQGNLVESGAYGGTTDGLELARYGYQFLPVLNFGETLSLEFRQMLWPVLLIAFLISWLIIVAHRRKQGIFLALLTAVPLVMIGLVSIQLNIFRPRYIILSSPAYVLLITSAIFITYQQAKSNMTQRILFVIMAGIIAGWVTLSGLSLRNYYSNPQYQKSPNWPALTDYLREHTQAGEVVIQTAVDSAYGFYYDAPADDFALPRSPDQPPEEIIANLEEWQTEYDSLWVVAETLQWPNKGIVEAWVAENMQLVRDTTIAGLPVREYKTWAVAPDEVDNTSAPQSTFGDGIHLMDARILPQEPTGEIPIWLYWQPQSTTQDSLTVFVHLIGDVNPVTGSPLWAQDDHPPQNGRATTDLWKTDTIYRDVYELPIGHIPAGIYEVYIGFYNPETNERLLTTNGSDAVNIGTITIE